MKYLSETKVCPPAQHRLGMVDGDTQTIHCGGCGITMAHTSAVYFKQVNAWVRKPIKEMIWKK